MSGSANQFDIIGWLLDGLNNFVRKMFGPVKSLENQPKTGIPTEPLENQPKTGIPTEPSAKKPKTGHLKKWTNYFWRYQKRYFVLSDGELSHYRNKAEVDSRSRGSINMSKATVSKKGSFDLIIKHTTSPKLYLKAFHQEGQEKWFSALESASKP